MSMIVCSGFYSYSVCFILLTVFYSTAIHSIAFTLTRSDISAGNSLLYRSIQLYHCFILSDACFLFLFCCLLYINDDMMMMVIISLTGI